MSSQQLIAEIEGAVRAGPSERRVAMLRRVTDLFLSDADHLNEQQLGVLVRLIKRVEAHALEQLSTSLSCLDRRRAWQADRSGRPARPDATRYSEAESFVLALNRSGKLTDAAVNRLAIECQTARIIVAIAVCCAVKPDTIEPLMVSAQTEGLVVACRASGLSWQTTHMILRNRFSGIVPSRAQIDEASAAFDSLSMATAQRTIRYWAARAAARMTF